MKISVAMTTYNGANYIQRQLDSILAQTRLPDEIVISDDCSTDETLKILFKYQNKMSSSNFIIISNKKNLGWRQNFAKAIKLTTGDLIFLADQDDEWDKNKIKEMESLICDNKDILLLVSQYIAIEENESIENMSIDSRKYSNTLMKMKFDKHFYMNHFPGCTYAFRSECRDWFLLPIWSKNQAHDEFIMTLARLKDRVYCFDKPLIFFIRHKTSATYGKKINYIDRIELLLEKEEEINIARRFLFIDKNIDYKNRKNDIINSCQTFLDFRIRWLEKPNLINFVKLLLKSSNYEKVSFLFSDIYCAFHR